MSENKKYKFLLLNAFSLPADSPYAHRSMEGPKESRLMNYKDIKHLLNDVDWDLHNGAIASYGDWPVETREEFAYASAARLPIVKEACESGKYNAIVLLGGGEPGFKESREIAKKYNIPVTSCAHSQFHFATLLGNKFSVIDISDLHNMYYYDLVISHRMTDRCASIRNLNFPLPRPGVTVNEPIHEEKKRALSGQRSNMLDTAIEESIAAIEEDGAEVITLGCSAAFWLKPFLERGLSELGWDIPVLEGYSCAIELAKSYVNLQLDVSGLMVPNDHPINYRRKKLF